MLTLIMQSNMKPLSWLIFVQIINSSIAITSSISWKPEEFCAFSFFKHSTGENALCILTSHINPLSLGYWVWTTSESECSSFQCCINSHYAISNKYSKQWGKRWTGARKGSASQGCWYSYHKHTTSKYHFSSVYSDTWNFKLILIKCC